MKRWHSIARHFAFGFRRGARADKVLAEAYRATFRDGGTDEQRQIVLADFANYTGFYRVSGPGMAAEDRAFADGMRAAYGRVFRFLRLSREELDALEEAARQEAVTDATEGQV